jgi:molybdopterin/thiamine biosynthesis adenylyltransferase
METLVIKDVQLDLSKKDIYILEPSFNDSFYKERTNRNIGWITFDEQELLKNSTVGIAGCGGMGGLLAATLARLGIGKIKIADNENFDITNLNRQYSSKINTIGKSKALATAKDMRDITDDIGIEIYPMGITRESVESFFDECDLICDEIEFWCIGSRTLLHQKSRNKNISILSCNTVGHQANLFFFDSSSRKIEEYSGFGLQEAYELENKLHRGEINKNDSRRLLSSLIHTLVPEQPNYGSIDENQTIRENVLRRLEKESTASIVATNPPMACGFMANYVLFELLKKSEVQRDVIMPPSFPGYISIDLGSMKFRRVER